MRQLHLLIFLLGSLGVPVKRLPSNSLLFLHPKTNGRITHIKTRDAEQQQQK